MIYVMSELSLREKEAVRNITGELVTTCLWNPQVMEAHGETPEHDIIVRRDSQGVSAEIKRK